MYRDKKVLCIIPARAGSKGLTGKNIKELLGKPLIAYSIKQAKQSKYIDRVIVSTESPEVAENSRQYGAEVPFLRPQELAADNSSIFDVLIHAIEWVERNENYVFDILVLLHANTPLRTIEDIDNCIQLLVEESADSVFSVTEAHRNPYFNMVELQEGTKVRLVKEGNNYINRQDAPVVYDMNSSIYVWWKDILRQKKSPFLEKSRIYVMPKERSIDIDDALDFKIAEMLMKEDLSDDKP